MKKFLPLIQVLLWFPVCVAAQSRVQQTAHAFTTTKSGEAWQDNAQAYLTKSEYFFSTKRATAYVFNRKQKLSFFITGNMITTSPVSFEPSSEPSWTSSLNLISINKGMGATAVHTGKMNASENNLTYAYGNYSVEYVNDATGLRQNFIIDQKPQGVNDLRVLMNFTGDLQPVLNDQQISLKNKAGKTFLQYDGLKVWDANHHALDARIEMMNNNAIALVVNDKHAVYPVTIDPLTHSPEWVTSADGVLPSLLTNLQLQVDALYGYNVTGLGDINADGYDDVAIGAPGATDVIGQNAIAGAGAVFVYFGSATGLPVTPSRVLRATTPIANALFGYSVAGGNVVGSANKDILVGAPGESYTATVAGIPSTATVTAGKVYVFNGATLASGPSAPTASIFLNGAGLFSRGITGVLASNIAVNALFGFSVSATEDMNGDGLGEIVVGAPGYTGIELTDVRSGGAFVYYSSNITGNTAVKLNVPSLLGFPSLLNIDGLLFGFSVDGAGDYDKDGKPDVIVGAPGGLNLGLSGFLGGSAYVYSGNGSGVNIAIKAQLAPSGPLLGAAANLFGYAVKGVKNLSGARTGNILVSAPAGNVLSNVTSGLRLKTGSIHVFTAKTSPAATESPMQSFSSPRGSNLLSQLLSLNIDVNSLFGASLDNMYDANCDGIADIIVGEPLSTGVGLVGVNAVGGAAYIFAGKADGTYITTPIWSLENNVSYDAGINAGSLLGYSVAGGGHIKGGMFGVKALIGAPGKMLDLGTGVLNLGNTVGTLFSFTSGNNGLGKVYEFAQGCDMLINPDINATHINQSVSGNVFINDIVSTGTTYGTPVPLTGNPAVASITMNTDGTYTFVAGTPGVYSYDVPVCIPGLACQVERLTITVLNVSAALNPPIANTDILVTTVNTAVTVNTLANDRAGNIGGALVASSITIAQAPLHGTASVDISTGNITYTPANGFTGADTLRYSVCDNGTPTPLCATAMQIVSVNGNGALNSTTASDDFTHIAMNMVATGNVSLNDMDAEGNTQTVTVQTTTVTGKGTLVLNANGSYNFTPVPSFRGPVSFTYTTCDNGTPSACAEATLYILVTQDTHPDLSPTTRISNATFVESAGTERDFVIEVNEVLGISADNISVPIRVRLTKSENFEYSFDQTASSANVPGTIAINNRDWSLVTNTSTAMIFQLKSTVSAIAGFGASRFSLHMKVNPGAASGVENQTISVINGSGTEVRFDNNAVVRILSLAN